MEAATSANSETTWLTRPGETRNHKMLPGLQPPWDQELPIWELRVGEYRVFYDVQEQARLVTVRAIRLKSPHKTTEEIL